MMVYKVRLIIFTVLFTLTSVFSSSSYANEKVYIDNWDIQQYKGSLGQWKLVESKGSLRYYINKFDSSYKDFYSINGKNIRFNDYLFIPYSEKYLKEINSGEAARKSVNITRDDFIWPVDGIDRITSPFGMRWGLFHNGIDLPKRKGTPVLAAMDGIVEQSGYSGGYGNTLSIQCRNRIFTRYSHNSVLLVKKGDLVKKGQVIAFMGSTGNSTGNHLHFEIRYKNIPLNPLDFLPKKENIKYGLNPDRKL